ncbi:pentatricopeptide repeat-containing protein At3g02490, mitochondrial-like [Silene latifolia]|uniref:pentatricopeptide repeat-containing protein At3g02490, mitochondrial-like n=1 Tax=Silene latifolia TaxID=37657 RepID=UPI003D771734
MRNQWRLLLRRNLLSTPRFSRPLFLHQVTPPSTATAAVVSSSSSLNYSNFTPNFHRFYSSDSSDSPTNTGKSPETSLVIDIFSKQLNHDEIKKELDDNNVVVSIDLINEVLKHLGSEPDTGIKLFNWVSKIDGKDVVLDSNFYNLMLGIYGRNGFVKEFWDLFDSMRKKGFGIKRGAYDCVLERFEKDGLVGDVEKMKGLFVKDASVETVSSRVRRIVVRDVWDESVEKDLKGLGIEYSTDLVKMVLEKLAFEPNKGLIFFRWLEESGLFKHDRVTYNTMAIVLGREDCVDRFWNVLRDMRNDGFKLEKRTYIKVLGRFIDRKMMKDAVGLFEFVMDEANKPSRQDCTFVLRKLATAKELDMELFSRVVKAFTGKGFALQDAMLDSVLKSLTSVGRMKECKKVLDAMVEAGFAPSGSMKARVAYDLSSSNLKDEADEYMENLEGHGLASDYKIWSSLIEGHCVAGDFDKARDCLEKMIEKQGICHVGYSLDMIVNSYCDRYRAAEACKMLTDLVNKKSNFKPWHVTYKSLITKLLGQRGFQDALPLLGLMKKHGFPPFVVPFIAYVGKKGTPDEAMKFFKAMTVKRYPSNSIFIRVFEAYSKEGRHKQAQDLLAKCPKYIRNHADVLNIFSSMKTEKPAEPKLAPVAA